MILKGLNINIKFEWVVIYDLVVNVKTAFDDKDDPNNFRRIAIKLAVVCLKSLLKF